MAPKPGVITARRAEVDQLVSGGQTLLEFAAAGDFDTLFDIREALLTRATTGSGGRPAWIALRMVNGDASSFSDVADRVSPQVDPKARSVKVRNAIADPPLSLTCGASVRGPVPAVEAGKIVLPAECGTVFGHGAAVWVVDRAKRTVSLMAATTLRHVGRAVVLHPGLEEEVQTWTGVHF